MTLRNDERDRGRTAVALVNSDNGERSARVGLRANEDTPTARLFDLHQLAAYLGVSYWTARDYVLQGLIPTVALPPLAPREGERARRSFRRVVVDVRDADRFIDALKARR